MSLKIVSAALASILTLSATAHACTNYTKIVETTCEQTCLNKSLGLCLISIVVSKGGLKNGTCSELGYFVANGTITEQAGPCGKIKFDEFRKPAGSDGAVLSPRASASCINYTKIVETTCAQTCLNKSLGLCPISIIVSKGGLKNGTCGELGYLVANGTITEQAGPCGKIKFDEFRKPATSP